MWASQFTYQLPNLPAIQPAQQAGLPTTQPTSQLASHSAVQPSIKLNRQTSLVAALVVLGLRHCILLRVHVHARCAPDQPTKPTKQSPSTQPTNQCNIGSPKGIARHMPQATLEGVTTTVATNGCQ